jgi:hypothetical protein
VPACAPPVRVTVMSDPELAEDETVGAGDWAAAELLESDAAVEDPDELLQAVNKAREAIRKVDFIIYNSQVIKYS